MASKERVQKGTENVFADIGVKNPGRVLVRAQVMSRIAEIIKKRGMTQKQASTLLKIPQSKISCLMNGKLSMFSLEHLFELLNGLDRNVEIIIKSKTKRQGSAKTQVRQTASA